MLRGCLFALLFWVALAGGYWYWFDHVFEPPGSIVGAAFVGLIVAASLGSIMNARSAFRDWSLAAASRHGLPPADGRVVAISGTIHPLDKPLIAPFSGSECVICEYDLGRGRHSSSTDEQTTAADYAGFLMTPCVIRTRLGDIRLLGFPILEGVTDTVCCGFDAANNGFKFLKGTEFEDRTGLKMVTVLGAFSEVWSDDDGLVQKNLRLRNVAPEAMFPLELFEELLQREQARLEAQESDADAPSRVGKAEQNQARQNDDDLDDDENDGNFEDDEWESDDPAELITALPRMTEKRIDEGESVCVIGTYSESHRGLLPKARGRQPNRLLRGTVEQVEQQSRRSLVSRLLGGLVGLIVVNAVVYGIMQLYLHSPDTISRRQREATEAVQQDDVAKLEDLLRRGLDPNFRDSNGRALLDLANQLRRDNIADLLRSSGAYD